MNYARIFALVLLVLMIGLSRRQYRSLLNPVVIFSFPFALILAYQELAFTSLPFGFRAAALIVAGPLGLWLGLTFTTQFSSAAPREERRLHVSPAAETLVRVLSWSGLAIALLYTWALREAIILGGVGQRGQVFYREVFFSTTGASMTYRLLHGGMLCAGFFMAIVAATRGMRRLPVIIYLLLAFLQAWISSTRLPFLIILLMFILASALTRPHTFVRLTPRVGRIILVSVLASLVLFTVVLQRRGSTPDEIRAKIAYTLVGGPSALSEYLDGNVQVDAPSGWGLTFAGVREALGGNKRALGAYQTSVEFERGVQASQTNVFTWYLPLLLDFTPAGVIGILMLLGMLIGPVSLRASRGQASPTAVGVLAVIYLLLIDASVHPLTYYNFFYVLPVIALFFNKLFRWDVSASRQNIEQVARESTHA